MSADRVPHPGALMARLRRPTAGESIRLAVVADPHVSTREEGTSKLFEHTLDHFEAAIADVAEREVDAVLSPGDLTKDGEPWNVEAVDEVLDGLDAPFYAVPGNHDAPKEGEERDSLSMSRFAEKYGPGDLPYRVKLGDLDLLAVNTAGDADRLFGSHDGHVDEGQREWLETELADAGNPLLLMHHNLPDVEGQLQRHREEVATDMAMPPVMRDPDALLDVLEGEVPLVLTGHYHLPTTGSNRGVREIATPTTCSFPQSYLLLEVTPRGTEVRLVPVADGDGLELAHHQRTGDSATARGLTSIAAARLASFPLVDEWES